VFFAAYTFLVLVAVLAGAVWAGLWHGPWLFPVISAAVLCLPPTALSLRQVFASKKWLDFFPLFVLYLTYGVARAKALLSVKNYF
jgi:hypothetical protein